MTRAQYAGYQYAGLGWPVIPLHWPTPNGCSCRRGDCDAVGKHPIISQWQTKATTDPTVIGRWWEHWPNANIGLVTGIAFDVLDIDSLDALDAVTSFVYAADGHLIRNGGTPSSHTSRGFHLLYKPTGSRNRIGIFPQIDWKGIGGFIVAPPSIHQSGHVYKWFASFGIDKTIIEAPAAILAKLAKPTTVREPRTIEPRRHSGRFNPSGLIRAVLNAPIGNRNDRLNWAAYRIGCEYRDGRATARDVENAINDLHDVAVSIGLNDQAAWRTIMSGIVSGTK